LTETETEMEMEMEMALRMKKREGSWFHPLEHVITRPRRGLEVLKKQNSLNQLIQQFVIQTP